MKKSNDPMFALKILSVFASILALALGVCIKNTQTTTDVRDSTEYIELQQQYSNLRSDYVELEHQQEETQAELQDAKKALAATNAELSRHEQKCKDCFFCNPPAPRMVPHASSSQSSQTTNASQATTSDKTETETQVEAKPTDAKSTTIQAPAKTDEDTTLPTPVKGPYDDDDVPRDPSDGPDWDNMTDEEIINYLDQEIPGVGTQFDVQHPYVYFDKNGRARGADAHTNSGYYYADKSGNVYKFDHLADVDGLITPQTPDEEAELMEKGTFVGTTNRRIP